MFSLPAKLKGQQVHQNPGPVLSDEEPLAAHGSGTLSAQAAASVGLRRAPSCIRRFVAHPFAERAAGQGAASSSPTRLRRRQAGAPRWACGPSGAVRALYSAPRSREGTSPARLAPAQCTPRRHVSLAFERQLPARRAACCRRKWQRRGKRVGDGGASDAVPGSTSSTCAVLLTFLLKFQTPLGTRVRSHTYLVDVRQS